MTFINLPMSKREITYVLFTWFHSSLCHHKKTLFLKSNCNLKSKSGIHAYIEQINSRGRSWGSRRWWSKRWRAESRSLREAQTPRCRWSSTLYSRLSSNHTSVPLYTTSWSPAMPHRSPSGTTPTHCGQSPGSGCCCECGRHRTGPGQSCQISGKLGINGRVRKHEVCTIKYLFIKRCNRCWELANPRFLSRSFLLTKLWSYLCMKDFNLKIKYVLYSPAFRQQHKWRTAARWVKRHKEGPEKSFFLNIWLTVSMKTNK